MRSLAAAYADYRNGKLSRRAERSGQPAYYIDKVEIINKSRLSDDTVQAMLNVRPDKVQTYETWRRDPSPLRPESFDRITYEVEERDGENVLVVDASEKNWGRVISTSSSASPMTSRAAPTTTSACPTP
jgi:NTE family protein